LWLNQISIVQIVVLEVSQGGLYSGPGNKCSFDAAKAAPLNITQTPNKPIAKIINRFISAPVSDYNSTCECHCNAFILYY
jgi:hypothetical protein